MGTKTPKEKFVGAIKVKQVYVDALTERWKDQAEVWKFVEAKKLTEQAASVKKMCSILKEAENIKPVLDMLIDAYLQSPPKNQLKRAIASCLENVAKNQSCVQDVLSNHVSRYLKVKSTINSRDTIDNCNSLLENFNLGECCLQGLLLETLSFLHDCLVQFYHESQLAESPVSLSESMHNCHVTVQVWNKLIARTEWLYVDESHKDQTEVTVILTKQLLTVWGILLDENFMMDCRGACAMTLPLVLRINNKSQVVEKVVTDLFPTSHVAKTMKPSDTGQSHLTDDQHPAWSTAMVCVAGGCLAMLSTEQLTAHIAPDKTLLCDVIGQQLLDLLHKTSEVSSKVHLSRTLVLWTAKAVQILEEFPKASKLLKQSLRGDGTIPISLFDYAWTHFEDATDVIRHQARLVFDNLLKSHLLASGEEPTSSPFLLGLLRSLVSSGWQQRGRYGPLCCLVRYLGTDVILREMPQLPSHLLAAMTDQTLAGYSAELYEELFSSHRRELSEGTGNISTWQSTWIDPLLDALCKGGRLQKTHVIEYILPKLLKHSPDCLPYITSKLSLEDKLDCAEGQKLGALVTTLKRAKMIGILRKDQLQQTGELGIMWYGVVKVDVLKNSLCHQNEQLRLDAFGLLVENLKTTEILGSVDLDLIKFFLPLNSSSQSPSFRQHLAGLLKRLFIRLRDGAQSLKRKIKTENEEAKIELAQYKDFVEWLLKEQFESLYIGASFPCRTMALSILCTYSDIMYEHGTFNHTEQSEFALSKLIREEHIQTLLECLTDSFEQNKMNAYQILVSIPHDKLHLQEEDRLDSLLQTALQLASSARPQDSLTAAYLFRVLLTQPALLEAAEKLLDKAASSNVNPTPAEIKYKRHLVVLQILLKQLNRQLDVARKSLIHAAATEPLYPTLLCIRYLMNDCDLSALDKSGPWRELVRCLIEICFQVAQVVSPVVSNSSPEGNVPLGPGLELQAVIQNEKDAKALQEAGRTVSLIPEYLVVCCWRSIKECSLLLGQLTQMCPLTDPNGDPGKGLLSVSQLDELGDYFTTQLLESRHRGAFELAYAGFVKMTEMLWKCTVAAVHKLPKQWLSEILDDIKSRDPNNRLCATRRSAGVPFYVQAIVSAEPATTGRTCFKQLMTQLLELAVPEEISPTVEDPAQVHALNVLRALYRDTRLGEDVFPYVAGGIKAAILGYSSQLWGIRNSATLLFSALITRIFGVKRSKDEASKKNCLTGRVFFHRFPTLYQFLLDQMAAGTSSIGSGGKYQLHPGLYPVLMVLARLYPSVVEGSSTTLNTAAFVPYVMRCVSSPVYKTRLMAARALRPLVGKDQMSQTLDLLLDSLPTGPDQATSQNSLHGQLLQLTELTQSVAELPAGQAVELSVSIAERLTQCSWILSKTNQCLVTRKSFTELCFSVLRLDESTSGTKAENDSHTTFRNFVLSQTWSELFSPSGPAPETPELSEYLQTVAQHLLVQVSSTGGFSQSQQGSGDHINYTIVDLVVGCLKSQAYEVRLEALDFLTQIFPSTLDKDKDDEAVIHCESVKVLTDNHQLYHYLVSMAMKETHTEGLTKVLEILCNHKIIHVVPWADARGVSHDPFKIMERLNQYKKHSSDEVRCAAHELSACVIPHLYKEAVQENKSGQAARAALCEWCGELGGRCATQESVLSRLTTAASLKPNVTSILTDPQHVLGPVVYDVWSVLVRLLQDEDVDVRQLAARVVHDVTTDHQETDTTTERADSSGWMPAPLVALDVAVSRLVVLRAERDWRGLFDCLLGWILRDLEPDWPIQEKEVRLFDKGEMNTYRDELVFVRIVGRHFAHFLHSSIATMSSTNTQSGSESDEPTSPTLQPNVRSVLADIRLRIVQEKLRELDNLSEARRLAVKDTVHHVGRPFLETSQYQEDKVNLTRHQIAMTCLSSVI